MDGGHVVLVFWMPPSSSGISGVPSIQLVGFERIEEVKEGETAVVEMQINVCEAFSLADELGERKLVTGQHTTVIGSPSEQQVLHRFDIKLASTTTAQGA
ncbi:hypothetical protein Ancab_017621 [Ancistrocladus abbreviatus]